MIDLQRALACLTGITGAGAWKQLVTQAGDAGAPCFGSGFLPPTTDHQHRRPAATVGMSCSPR